MPNAFFTSHRSYMPALFEVNSPKLNHPVIDYKVLNDLPLLPSRLMCTGCMEREVEDLRLRTSMLMVRPPLFTA